MTDENDERIARALRGECPDCGSTLQDHISIALAHGHEFAVAGDVLREQIAAQLQIDPELVFMQLHTSEETSLDEALNNHIRLLTGQDIKEISGDVHTRKSKSDTAPAGAYDMVSWPPVMPQSPPQRKGVEPALWALGILGITVITGIFGTLLVVDRLIRGLVKRGLVLPAIEEDS